jgi:hypothetical protein
VDLEGTLVKTAKGLGICLGDDWGVVFLTMLTRSIAFSS